MVWILGPAYRFIIAEANKWDDHETGGVLAGYYAQDEVVVTEAVGPGPMAMHEKTAFKPDNKYHQKELARIYKESGRIDRYLGDWHTHPKSTAYLSELDKSTLKNIGAYKKAQLSIPIMLVLGTHKMELKIWVYYINDKGREVLEACRTIITKD